MQKSFPYELEKTATFFHPLEVKQGRYVKSSIKLNEFSLSVKGKSILTKSNPSTSETINRHPSSSITQSEQATPPQKKPSLTRKSSQLQVRSEDKAPIQRVLSSNIYQKGSYEFQFKGNDFREISFGEQEAQKFDNQFRRSGRRFIVKATQHFEEEQPQPPPPQNTNHYLTKPRNSPQSAGSKNKLPEIFQTSQKQTIMQQEKSMMLQSKRTLNGFRVQSHQQQRVYENEFLNLQPNVERQTPPPEHVSRVSSIYDHSIQLPRIDAAMITKSRPFLQRKPQTKIIDRIFSGKSQN